MCSSLAFNWVIILGHLNKPSPPQYNVLSNDHKTPQHPLRSWITYAHALSSKCTHGVGRCFNITSLVCCWGQLPISQLFGANFPRFFSGQPTIFHSLPQPSTHLVRENHTMKEEHFVFSKVIHTCSKPTEQNIDCRVQRLQTLIEYHT